MTNYWNRPKSSDTVRDGSVYTHDIGRFDERGFLHLVDRRDTMITSRGENVCFAEVEST